MWRSSMTRISRRVARSPGERLSSGSARNPVLDRVRRLALAAGRPGKISEPGRGGETVTALYDAPVSEPHIRKVRPDELEEVWRVHVAASNDLLVRGGRLAARPADAPVASDPDGYFCAVEEGQIRGMVSALVRGRVWYLSMFFVLPGDQGRGLGRALLERALAYGEARGAEIRCTLATLDPRAQARYVMAGMPPRWPIYRLDGDAAAVTRLKARAGLDPRAQDLPCDPGAAEKLTAEVFGHGRADDLAHFRGDGGAAVAIERG